MCSRVGRGGVTSHQSRFPSCHHLPTSLITTNAIAIYNLTLGTTRSPQVTITAPHVYVEKTGIIVGHGNHPMGFSARVWRLAVCFTQLQTYNIVNIPPPFLLSWIPRVRKIAINWRVWWRWPWCEGGKWMWQKGLDEKVRSVAVRHEKVWKSVAGENGQTERSAISWHSFSNSRDR